MSEIKISGMRILDEVQKNGNAALCTFDLSIAGLVEIKGLLLLKYENGRISTFSPTHIHRDTITGACFPDQDLRHDVIEAAINVYRKMGGQHLPDHLKRPIHGLKPAPDNVKFLNAVEMADLTSESKVAG